MNQQTNLWTKADFLDRAQELKRRLEVWQIDGNEPVYCPREIVAFQTAIKSVFRNRVMLGEHDPHPTFTTQSILGNSFIRNPKDPYAKWITIWELRDFVEHLADAGDSEGAKLIRLTIARLLDSPMHSRARSQVFGVYVAGREVDSSLLEDFMNAVTDFAFSRSMGTNDEKQAVVPTKNAKPVVEPMTIQVVPAKTIDRAKHDRNDWLLTQRGMDHKPKMSELDLSKALAVACETHVDWVHIEPRTIASALREAYTRKTGNPWTFDGRGRTKVKPEAKPKNTRKR